MSNLPAQTSAVPLSNDAMRAAELVAAMAANADTDDSTPFGETHERFTEHGKDYDHSAYFGIN